jgi:hypothetical protein
MDLVWKRTAVFWVFAAEIFVAVVAALQQGWPRLSVALSLTGVVFSLTWTLANRGSRSWQESWELKAERFLEVDIYSVYSDGPIYMNFRWLDRRKAPAAQRSRCW